MFTNLAAPLSERAELASSRWIEIANSFLKEQSGTPDLTTPYRLSTQLRNPPPHLKRENFGYTVTFTKETASVSVGSSNEAECQRTCDYNHRLPFTWLINEDNPEGDRLSREYTHLFPKGNPEAQYSEPIPKRIRAVLSALHDHMARRTINNPDIEHRAEAYGLTQNLRELDNEGYTILPNAFTREYADILREETNENHADRKEGASFRATMLLKRGRIWEEAVIHPWVLTTAEYLIGRGCLLYQSDTIVKGTGQETHPGLHSDYSASRITEPFPEYCLEATAVWAIDDFHKKHGPTCVLPGSFRKGAHVATETTQKGTKLLEMDQGSIAFWHGALWHGSTPRSAPGKRTSLHNAYSRSFIRPLERYEDIDPKIIKRNPPVFSTLCGLDDAFGKSGQEGADFERFAYAAKQGYASSAAPVSETNRT